MKDCSICLEKFDKFEETKCCRQILCPNCDNKLGSCPFCREVWDTDKDQKIKNEIRYELNEQYTSDPLLSNEMIHVIDIVRPYLYSELGESGNLVLSESERMILINNLYDTIQNSLTDETLHELNNIA